MLRGRIGRVLGRVAVSSVVFLTLINRQSGFFQNVEFLNLERTGRALQRRQPLQRAIDRQTHGGRLQRDTQAGPGAR